MGYTESGHQGQGLQSFSKGPGLSSRCFFLIVPILVLLFFPFLDASGQRKSDIGIIAGTSYYLGDVNHSRHFYSPSATGGVMWRYNFNPRNSLRFSGLYVPLTGDPSDFNEPYPGFTGEVNFPNLIDLDISTEFNFKAYETTKLRRNRHTPYLSGGLGYTIPVGGGEPAAHISFGGGFKYNVTMRLSTGLEWTFRKTFTDMLDGVQNIGAENSAFFHNKDWYSIVGVFVTYKIFDWGLDCPAYE